MRKEILFAIVAGGLFGLVIAFGIWRANKSLAPVGNVFTQNTETPVPQTSDTLRIAVAKPLLWDVISEKTISVSAITKPLSKVLISGQDNYYFTSAGESGEFEIDVDLVGGINEISLSAFDDSGNSIKETVFVVYSSEFPKKTDEKGSDPSPAPSPTDSVREKVQEKINQVSNSPIAYVGTITDISDTTIQLTKYIPEKAAGESGEILQVSADDKIKYVNSVETTKEIKRSDLAIGDFIIAMGYKNGNSVLNAVRVVVTPPYESHGTLAFLVNGTKATSSKLDAIDTKSNDLSFKFDKSTEISSYEAGKLKSAKYTDIDDNILLGVFASLSENEYTAKSVILLEQTEKE